MCYRIVYAVSEEHEDTEVWKSKSTLGSEEIFKKSLKMLKDECAFISLTGL